jgi:hypothetical protein
VFKVCKDSRSSIQDMPLRKSSPDGRCFPCKRARHKIYSQNYVARDPERRKKQANDYAAKNKSRASDNNRKRKYGLSNEDVALRVAAQGGLCGLCRGEFSWGQTFVDHDHDCCPRVDGNETTCGNCVRAILCRLCNQGLGMFNEDPDRLREAADYIERYRK